MYIFLRFVLEKKWEVPQSQIKADKQLKRKVRNEENRKKEEINQMLVEECYIEVKKDGLSVCEGGRRRRSRKR